MDDYKEPTNFQIKVDENDEIQENIEFAICMEIKNSFLPFVEPPTQFEPTLEYLSLFLSLFIDSLNNTKRLSSELLQLLSQSSFFQNLFQISDPTIILQTCKLIHSILILPSFSSYDQALDSKWSDICDQVLIQGGFHFILDHLFSTNLDIIHQITLLLLQFLLNEPYHRALFYSSGIISAFLHFLIQHYDIYQKFHSQLDHQSQYNEIIINYVDYLIQFQPNHIPPFPDEISNEISSEDYNDIIDSICTFIASIVQVFLVPFKIKSKNNQQLNPEIIQLYKEKFWNLTQNELFQTNPIFDYNLFIQYLEHGVHDKDFVAAVSILSILENQNISYFTLHLMNNAVIIYPFLLYHFLQFYDQVLSRLCNHLEESSSDQSEDLHIELMRAFNLLMYKDYEEEEEADNDEDNDDDEKEEQDKKEENNSGLQREDKRETILEEDETKIKSEFINNKILPYSSSILTIISFNNSSSIIAAKTLHVLIDYLYRNQLLSFEKEKEYFTFIIQSFSDFQISLKANLCYSLMFLINKTPALLESLESEDPDLLFSVFQEMIELLDYQNIDVMTMLLEGFKNLFYKSIKDRTFKWICLFLESSDGLYEDYLTEIIENDYSALTTRPAIEILNIIKTFLQNNNE